MTSHDIIKLLSANHADDVFVTECKNGPTQTRVHSRLDAWVMNKSWAHLTFTGYEVKVSRADFKNDEKWPAYLPLCNQLYFVCPKDLIKRDEVPDGVGLKYCTPSRVYTVIKAAHREIEPPVELMEYILMCRTTIKSDLIVSEKYSRLDECKAWLAKKEEDQEIGDLVAWKLAEKIRAIKRRNEDLEKRLVFIETSERVLKEMGISDWFRQANEDSIRKQAEKFLACVPSGFADSVIRLTKQCNELLVELEKQRVKSLAKNDL
jgi:hypothetical protein